MARISSATPSNADVAKEVTLLQKQGKLDSSNKPIEWTSNWKAGG